MLVDELVIDVNFPWCFAVLTGALIHRYKLNQLYTHLTGEFRHFHIGFQSADKLVNIGFVLVGFCLPLLDIGKLGFQLVLFFNIPIEKINANILGDLACDLVLISRRYELFKLS